jgi:tripartite-type tricarboxylate transporter receptor subunit TctC
MMLPVRWTGPPVGPQVKEWKPRALAVASKMRSRALPDLPTMAEIGYPDIEGEAWFAVIVLARTPKEIITLLHQEVVKLLALPV